MKWNKPGMPTPSIFTWEDVQIAWDEIDAQVYRLAIEKAKELFLDQASPCPKCRRPPADLIWMNIDTPEQTWTEGKGLNGWLTVCESCNIQVNFLVDAELTEIENDERQHESKRPGM